MRRAYLEQEAPSASKSTCRSESETLGSHRTHREGTLSVWRPRLVYACSCVTLLLLLSNWQVLQRHLSSSESTQFPSHVALRLKRKKVQLRPSEVPQPADEVEVDGAGGEVLEQACWRPRQVTERLQPMAVEGVPSVIPQPVEMNCSREGAAFNLSDSTVLTASNVAKHLLAYFRQHFRCFFDFDLKTSQDGSRASVQLQVSKILPAEGYALDITPQRLRIVVSVVTEKASLLYALQSLRQLLPGAIFGRSPGNLMPLQVPQCEINDWPRYKWRGVMLDVARHFFNVDQVFDLMYMMSLHKLNTLQLHLSDDQGWRVEVASKPELVKVGAIRGKSVNDPLGNGEGEKIFNGTEYQTPRFFSISDIRRIVARASFLNIEVVPEIDVPAHTAALIVAASSAGKDVGVVELHEGCKAFQSEQQLTAPPNCMGGTHGIIWPTDKALEYVLDAIGEVADLFPGRYFHMGGDEADEFRDEVYYSMQINAANVSNAEGRQNAPFAEMFDSPSAWQGHVMDEVYKVLLNKGKTVIAWDETFTSLGGYQPPGNVVMMWWRDWSEESEFETVKALAEYYHRHWVLAPMSKLYMDVYQVEPHSESRFRVQEGTVSLWNTYNAAQLVPGDFALGVQGCLWSEHFEQQDILEYQLFPRGAALAEVGWTQKHLTNFDDFVRRWHLHTNRLAAAGIRFYNGSYFGAAPVSVIVDIDGNEFVQDVFA